MICKLVLMKKHVSRGHICHICHRCILNEYLTINIDFKQQSCVDSQSDGHSTCEHGFPAVLHMGHLAVSQRASSQTIA